MGRGFTGCPTTRFFEVFDALGLDMISGHNNGTGLAEKT